MMKSSLPLKVAILVKEPIVNQYLRDLILKIKVDPNVSIDDLLIMKVKARQLPAIFTLLFKCILFLERIFLFRNRNVNHIINQHDISSLFKKIIKVDLTNDLQESEMLTSLKTQNYDLIIKIADEIDNMELLADCASLGLIAAEFSDDVENENLLSGFWEVFYRRDTTNFNISRISQDKSREMILQCSFQTRYCFLLNKAFLYKKAGTHLLEFVKKVSSERSLKTTQKISQLFTKSNKLYRVNSATFFKYVFQTGIIILGKITRTMYYRGFRWHVVIYNKFFTDTIIRKPRIIPNPYLRFLADPFLISYEEKTYCFVEDCDYLTKKGRISVFEVMPDSFSEIKPCLEEDFHLSFPFVFKYHEQYYMCPETCDSDQIRLYRATNFPFEWKLETILMENVRAADTMIFETGGRWWMLTNIDPSRIGDNSSELYLFYADNPLSKNWISHKNNPIYINSTRARNGGLILNEQTILRVAQKQKFDKYGANVSIFKISEINEDNYKEEWVQTVEPDYLPNILGTHHMSANSKFTALDFYNTGEEFSQNGN